MSRSRTGSYRKSIAARPVSNSRRLFLWSKVSLWSIKRQITNPISACKSQLPLLDKRKPLKREGCHLSPSPLSHPCFLSLIFMEPKRSHGPLKRCVCDRIMRPQEVLTIYINNAVKAASRLAVYLFSQVNRPVASLRSIFLLPSFVIFQQLFMPPTRPDATNLYIFSAFPLPWTHLTRNLACQAASLPGPVVQRRGPPRNQLLTWHNLWANHANLVFSVPLWNHTTSDAGGGGSAVEWGLEGVSGSSRFKAQVIGTLSKGK